MESTPDTEKILCQVFVYAKKDNKQMQLNTRICVIP